MFIIFLYELLLVVKTKLKPSCSVNVYLSEYLKKFIVTAKLIKKQSEKD